MAAAVPFGVDIVSQDTLSVQQLNSFRGANGTAKFSKTLTQFELVDTRAGASRNVSATGPRSNYDSKHRLYKPPNYDRRQDQASNHLGDTLQPKQTSEYHSRTASPTSHNVSENARSMIPQEKSHRGFQINESTNFKLKQTGPEQRPAPNQEKDKVNQDKAAGDPGNKAFKFLQVKSQFNTNKNLVLKIEDTSVDDSFTGISDDASRGRRSRAGRQEDT